MLDYVLPLPWCSCEGGTLRRVLSHQILSLDQVIQVAEVFAYTLSNLTTYHFEFVVARRQGARRCVPARKYLYSLIRELLMKSKLRRTRAKNSTSPRQFLIRLLRPNKFLWVKEFFGRARGLKIMRSRCLRNQLNWKRTSIYGESVVYNLARGGKVTLEK